MLTGNFASNGGAPHLGSPAQDLVILGFSGPRLAASSASFASEGARPTITAALDKSAGGAPAFDRTGALVGLVAPIAGEPKRVGGVALASPHPLIAPDALRAFLGVNEPVVRARRYAQRGRHRRPREDRRWSPSSARNRRRRLRARSVRDHAREDVLLQRDQHAEDQRQDDAVPEGAREHDAFVPPQVRDGDARRDVLR